MNTVRLFDKDSYIRDFEARVVSLCRTKMGYGVVLDQTAFFPEAGGQKADHGFIRDMEVVDVQEVDGIIYHEIICADDSLIREMVPGQTVHCHLDWHRRFNYMQQHSGEHIVSGIIHGRYGYDNVGFHLSDDIVTLDFNGVLTPEQLRDIEEEANYAVVSNRQVTVTYPSREELETIRYRSKIEIEGQIRLVTIEDYDVCACCAPHVAMTGEIGQIKFLSCQNYKGGIRLTIACGFRALEEHRMKQENIGCIGSLLSVKPEETSDAVKKMHEELLNTRYQWMAAKEELILCKLENLDMKQKNLCYFDADMPSLLMKKALNALVLKRKSANPEAGFCGVFSGNDAEGYQYFIGGVSQDARIAGEILKNTFSCRGGGKPEMIQGKIQGSRAAIEEVFTKL